MLDGLKGMFSPDNNNPKNPKSGRRIFLIIVGIVLLAVIHMGYNFISGSDEERNTMIEYARTHFHINVIDLSICTVLFIVYIILKIKDRKK